MTEISGQSMVFPETPRVAYKKNPLHQVICQVRFPPILRIDSENPVDFQDAIRQQYPLFRKKIEQLQLFEQTSQPVPPISVGTAYEFVSSDEKWIVSLMSHFLALTCNQYGRWEDFKGHFTQPFETFVNTYSPPFISRIGLRYTNIIKRSALGLEKVRWAELLQPYIVNELAYLDEKIVQERMNTLTVRLEDNLGLVRVLHGLVKLENDDEWCYLIDNDFFADDKKEVADVFKTLDQFNRQSRKLFRWCISDRLYDAMEPQPI